MRRRLLKSLPIALRFGFYMSGGIGLIRSGRWTDMRLQIFLFFAWGGCALMLAMQNAGKPNRRLLEMDPWSAPFLAVMLIGLIGGALWAPDGRRILTGTLFAGAGALVVYAIYRIFRRRQPANPRAGDRPPHRSGPPLPKRPRGDSNTRPTV